MLGARLENNARDGLDPLEVAVGEWACLYQERI